MTDRLTKIQELQAYCRQLEETQRSMESIIAESNTRQLHAEIENMKLEQIFWAVTDPLWVLDDKGIVLRTNEAMLNFLDCSDTDVIGQQSSELLQYEFCCGKNSPIKKPLIDKKYEQDIQIKQADGQWEFFILTTAPLKTIVGSAGIVCQFKNITSRKQAEDKLAVLNKTLEELASIDGLTQIANRRHFDDTLTKEWKRLARDKKPISLLLADIDFFKKYNDHYGHQAGDGCLKKVATALAATVLRPADLAARYGGEEFVLLLPEIEIKGALCVAERVLESIRKLNIEHADSSIAPIVTLSLGAATLIPCADNSPKKLIELADHALYYSKDTGRNRVTEAPPA